MRLLAARTAGAIAPDRSTGSRWGETVTRALSKERFLSGNLRGYATYMTKTGSRLVPGIW
jgi:hypothetical protein